MTGSNDKYAASWSLRRSLTRMLLLAALLPVLVFGIALLWSQWQRDRDELLLRLSTNAQSSASTFDDFLDSHLAGVRLLAATPLAASASPPDAALDRLLKAYPSFLRALATDADGDIVAARAANGQSMAPTGENAADRDWFRAPRDSGLAHVSDGYRARIDGDEALVAVSAPLLREGRFDGVLQASLPVERLVRERASTLRRRGLELLLLDRGERVVYASSGLRWHFLDATGALGADIRDGASASGQIARARILPGLLAGD